MANEDLFKSMQMFTQGVNDLATTHAIREANAQVHEIRNSMLKEEEQMQALRGVASDFTMRLAGMGAPAAQIEQVSQAIAPKPQTLQTLDQAILMGSPEKRELAIAEKKREEAAALRLAGAKNTFKLEDKSTQNVLGALNTFRDKVAKKDLEALGEFGRIEPLLKAGNNLGYVTGLKTIIKTTDPRISNEDFVLALPNTSLGNRAKRVFMAAFNNEPLPEDVEAAKLVADTLQERITGNIREKATGFARTRSKILKLDQNELLQSLLTESLPGYSTANPAAAPQTPQQSMESALLPPGGTAPRAGGSRYLITPPGGRR